MTPGDILHFWFTESTSDDWFAKNDSFDNLLRERFLDTHKQVARGAMAPWRTIPEGSLAEIVVLDQFSRNLFRGTPEAFAQDAFALSLAKEAVARGDDQRVPALWRQFFYMPYMHSESLEVHREALPLFVKLGIESQLRYEHEHRNIIERFGRYPHRNAILGRATTPEEEEFLKGHSGF